MQTEFKIAKTSDLIPYARNSRTHSDAQVAKIASSIKEFGFLNPVIVDGDNGIIAGHGRIMAAQKLGIEEVPTIEAAYLSEAQKRAYIIADNRLALDAGWDDEMLRVELQDLQNLDFDLSLTGFDPKELDKLFNFDAQENAYTQKADRPIYEPTGPKPKFEELYDDSYTRELLYGIEGSGVTDEEKTFLTLAAGRHTIFNFETIANFYAHASPECQQLMEDSALVIVDINKAIEKGFVIMSDKISEQYLQDWPDGE